MNINIFSVKTDEDFKAIRIGEEITTNSKIYWEIEKSILIFFEEAK